MNRIIGCIVLAGLMAALAGCEWTAGGGVESWDSSSSWVDFSGVYRKPNGGYLVTKYTTSTDWTNTVVSTNSAQETLATAGGTETVFQGTLQQQPVPGTLTVIAGAYAFTDDSSDSSTGTYDLDSNVADGSAGTINHATGQWTLRFPGPLAAQTQITATYQYLSTTQQTGTGRGNHGAGIYSLVIYQQGNTLKLIDSNNSVFTGSLGAVRRQGDLADPSPTADPNQQSTIIKGSVIAQFSATGVSQGYTVTIVGTLEFLASGTYSDRTLTGTFIESGGYTGDINGQAQRINITTNTTSLVASP